MTSMRQVVLPEPGHVEIQETARPEPTPGAVLIRVRYCGICGTDLMFFRGQTVWGRDSYPKYPGHEFSGTVEAEGEGVQGLPHGERVVAECTIGCGVCVECRAGRYSLCRNRLGFSNGAMADYVRVPAKAVHRLPDGVDLLHGALIEPVAVGCAAALKCGGVFGRRVGVIGAGTIGLGALMTFQTVGAAQTLLVDIREDRLVVGRAMGADTVDASVVDAAPAVLDATHGHGLDAVVVASAGTAQTLGLALAVAAAGGVISVVGLSGGQASSLDGDALSEKEVAVVGSHSSPGVWEGLLACVEAGRYRLGPLISHVLPLERADEAFRLLDDPSQSAQKVVLST